MVFPVVGGDGKPTGYDIDNSLRLMMMIVLKDYTLTHLVWFNNLQPTFSKNIG